MGEVRGRGVRERWEVGGAERWKSARARRSKGREANQSLLLAAKALINQVDRIPVVIRVEPKRGGGHLKNVSVIIRGRACDGTVVLFTRNGGYCARSSLFLLLCD